MSYYRETKCPRCGHPLDGPHYDGCPACRHNKIAVNYETYYDLNEAALPDFPENGASDRNNGIFSYENFLPLGTSDPKISIGEGNTPFYKLERLGRLWGMDHLYMKDESKNPTMSHKDRLCSIIVSQAVRDNAPGVVISSTGNQGASAAAYCAAADIPCVIFTTPNVSSVMKTWMQAYGASVFVTPTMADRSIIMGKLVREMGFTPASGMLTPPIGSNPFAVDGYKTISFEIYRQMDKNVPDWMVVPISYGDTLYGIFKGMCDLKEMGYIRSLPRMAAAEVFGAAQKSLAAGSDLPVSTPSTPSIQTSIATGYITYQTLKALRLSNGTARTSTDPEALSMQLLLARTEGIFAEASSVSSLVATKKLLDERKISPDDRVVVLITSTGLKDPKTTESLLPKIPVIEPSIPSFLTAIKDFYHIVL